MKFSSLLQLVGDEPVFETSLLLAGNVDVKNVSLQLGRWTESGKLIQLRRGLYALAAPYRKLVAHPFLVANRLRRASYVSCQSVLAFYGLIPDTLHATVSVTSGRPEKLDTPLGSFEFRHVKPELLRGYRMTDLGGQDALLATPEKALLDLVYLVPGGDAPEYLRELRLQNLTQLDLKELGRLVEIFASPKSRRAAQQIVRMAKTGEMEYQTI